MLGSVPILLFVMAALHQAPVTIVQKTSGWCSPAIANVVGNVTVNCIGVDARALQRLNAELNRKNLELAEKIREADQWTTKYKELEKQLSQASDDSALSREAEEYLRAGELEKAGAALDQILSKEERRVDRAAANHYNRGLLFELQFRPLDALPHFEKAYRYRPEEVMFGLRYAGALADENDFKSAEPVLSATLIRSRDLAKTNPATYDPYVAAALNNLASVYSNTQRLKEAEAALQEALEIRRAMATANQAVQSTIVLNDSSSPGMNAGEAAFKKALAEAKPAMLQPEVAVMLNNLATLYHKTNQLKEAEAALQEALDIDRQLMKADRAGYQSEVASALHNLANLYSDTQRLKEAEAAYKEALEMRRQLAKTNPAAYQFDFANTLDSLANLYCHTQRLEEAEAAYREALDILRPLAKANPAAHLSYVALTLNNLGNLYRDTRRAKQAEAAFLDAVEIQRQLVNVSPDAFEPSLADTLNNLALLYMDAHYFHEAEEPLKEALKIRRGLAKANPAAYNPDLADTLQGLGILYNATQRAEAARAAYEETLAIRRELSRTYPAVFRPLVAETLSNLALFYAGVQRIKDAEAAYKESTETYRQLAQVNPTAYKPHLARVLINLAEFHADAGLLTEARVEAEEAVTIDREWWKENPNAASDYLAKSLVILSEVLTLTHQPLSTICPLLREAASAAYDQELKDLAISQATACNAH